MKKKVKRVKKVKKKMATKEIVVPASMVVMRKSTLKKFARAFGYIEKGLELAHEARKEF